MLGITVPDAIAIGTLVIALLAAWRGTGAARAAKEMHPPPDSSMSMIGAAIVDRTTLADLTTAVLKLVAVIDRVADSREQQLQEKLDALIAKLAENEFRHGRR